MIQALSDDQVKRAIREILEDSDVGLPELALEAAVEELDGMAMTVAIYQLWAEGYTAIGWNVADGVTWRSIKPYRDPA